MRYTLQHANSRDLSGDGTWFAAEANIEYDAGTLPRVGESVEYEGKGYVVQHVFHEITNGKQGQPTVRVK